VTIGTGFTPGVPEITAPALSLPVSGGAIRGIGETFGTDPFTGTASMAVPVATSPGRGGFGPSLALSYGSGQGNGPFGIGWSARASSIWTTLHSRPPPSRSLPSHAVTG
jgi:hypothetical protein